MPVHVDGSSPRVRGTPRGRPAAPRWRRFIPACAGNSRPIRRICRGPPVHPRVCGELRGRRSATPSPAGSSPRVRRNSLRLKSLAFVLAGSSPRVRGTRRQRIGRRPLMRFIPACAGNSCCGAATPWRCPVHPRVCGELVSGSNSQSSGRGSSPRVRGTHPHHGRQRVRLRFIPACAGNSAASIAFRIRATVHPRVCGELWWNDDTFPADDGSSPRVRGTPRAKRRLFAIARFIPACAGNSHLADRREDGRAGSSPRVRGTRQGVSGGRRVVQVHPRVCGELSSPVAPIPRGRRFIPACAGNSAWACAGTGRRTVHPRVCGELPPPHRLRGATERFIPACAGNSAPACVYGRLQPVHPRVCGELELQALRALRHRRFIPACAGNSLPALRANVSATGSSPRVRGTRKTPCVGLASCAVHPRVCGELQDAVDVGLHVGGSSPRVRGTRTKLACWCAAWTVHPRVCGELDSLRVLPHALFGSSPRVRGTRGGRTAGWRA